MKTKFFTIMGACYVAYALVVATNSSLTPLNRGGAGPGSQGTLAQENQGSDGDTSRLSEFTEGSALRKPENQAWHGWLPVQARLAHEADKDKAPVVGEDPTKNFQPNCLIFWTLKGCQSCEKMYPVVEKLQKEGYIVYILEYEENRALGQAAGVRSLPTFIIWEAQKEVARHVGLISAEELKKILKKNKQSGYDIW